MEESDSTVTVVTWNVNCILALCRSSEFKQLLDSFHADVICMQETSIPKDSLPRTTANVEGYTSYYSFPHKGGSYAGVATYCSDDFVPFAADEGISGVANTSADQVGSHRIVTEKFPKSVLTGIDFEGRGVITKHKFTVRGRRERKELVIINVYPPRAKPTEEENLQLKQFYEVLETRIKEFLENEIHVIVVGDLNAVHKPIDHYDPSDFEQSTDPSRMWLNKILWDPKKRRSAKTKSGNKPIQLIDAFRYMHPKQENAFTYWSPQLADARAKNHGSRIDYILIDAGLKVRVKECSILKHVTGSHHGPVKIVLNVKGVYSQRVPTLSAEHDLECFMLAGKRLDVMGLLGTKVQQVDDPVDERKRKPSVTKTKTKRQKRTEQVSKTASSHDEDRVKTGNTDSASSVTVHENKEMDVNLPSTSSSTASVSGVKMVPASKRKGTKKYH